jgi:hypothetical protein
LADETPPSGADRRAHADLALTRDRSRQEQVRHVRAREQQDEPDGEQENDGNRSRTEFLAQAAHFR